MNFMENNYEKTKFLRYFQKPTLRPKIDLGDKPRKIWVKRVSLIVLFLLHAC